MLDIFITVDTEVSFRGISAAEMSADRFSAAYRRDILGRTRAGDYGIPLQLKIMNDHQIEASFFVESLFPSAVGIQPLADVIGMVREAGHDLQMHMHVEWARAVADLQSHYRGENLAGYPEDVQFDMLKIGQSNLAAAGVEHPRAFRAGNYGADNATLRALSRLGIEFDSSYNYCYLGKGCEIRARGPVLQSTLIEGVTEIPINYFYDRPGHSRHAQLTACSFAELSSMLNQACERDWSTFVIVSHSFELLNPRRNASDPIIRRRFEKLCRFIEKNNDRMRVRTFSKLDASHSKPHAPSVPLHSDVMTTLSRLGEQFVRRLRVKPNLI